LLSQCRWVQPTQDSRVTLDLGNLEPCVCVTRACRILMRMSDLEQLESLVDNGTPLVFVETADPSRLEDICARLSTRCSRPSFRWSLASGLTRNGGGTLMGPGAQPAQVLQHVLSIREPSLFLLLDLSKFLDDALIVSQLREVALRNRAGQHCLLMAGAAID